MAADPTPAAGRPSVWITRAEPGAGASADRVEALGCSALIAPLLSFQPLEGDLAMRPGEALAFTSLNGVQRAAALLTERDMRVFAVGDATAAGARAAGFSEVASAGGDVEALTRLIRRCGWRGGVLHPCARQTAGDLAGALRAMGLAARTVAVYETVAAVVLPAKAALALGHGLRAVLFHSPKAARVAADLLRGRHGALGSVTAIGLSPACLAPLQGLGWRTTLAPAAPTEDALMAMLATDLTPKDADGRG